MELSASSTSPIPSRRKDDTGFSVSIVGDDEQVKGLGEVEVNAEAADGFPWKPNGKSKGRELSPEQGKVLLQQGD